MLGKKNICFIGAGQMANAVVGGILRNGLVDASNISMVDPHEGPRDYVRRTYKGIKTAPSPTNVLPLADIAVLAVKPNIAPQVMHSIKGLLKPKGVLVLSVMAGVTIDDLEEALDGNIHRIIRTMPNANVTVAAGCVGYAMGNNTDEIDEGIVRKIFDSLGVCAKVTEGQMAGITGLSGSGPAFVASFIEALSDAGVKNGLPRDLAKTFAVNTVLGTAKLIQERDLSTLQVKEMVCSPGGTTIAGIEALEKNGLRYATMSAVTAAAEKSILMSMKKL
ncbi:delta-1-pyrroline-5-carboxylate reductase, putative [Bodo saltans]|uniref:Delta-1-pyrroline-5-carboxylate reductase, putative n=1 Tax=Bodo saltans TaxID=75058 RepID=A0A0S4JPA1_BODSA|nr:delta-1-pyrroline-5-carboxylate reductase, putative [Bodo saltans]|eukprot:CUG92123.1 delta-1-pyrroline-5-carboxylate reductase, putative [Bodo saltans]